MAHANFQLTITVELKNKPEDEIREAILLITNAYGNQVDALRKVDIWLGEYLAAIDIEPLGSNKEPPTSYTAS